MYTTSIIASLALIKFSVAGYTVQDDYSVGNFFNMFDFFTSSDPTHGFGMSINPTPKTFANLFIS